MNIEQADIRLAHRNGDDDLLPCPFCGSHEIAYAKYEHTCGLRWAVLCMGCMAQIDPGWAQRWGTVQKLWNTRSLAEEALKKPEETANECPGFELNDCFLWRGVEKGAER